MKKQQTMTEMLDDPRLEELISKEIKRQIEGGGPAYPYFYLNRTDSLAPTSIIAHYKRIITNQSALPTTVVQFIRRVVSAALGTLMAESDGQE